MKAIFKTKYIIAIWALALISCEKDEERAILVPGSSSSLTVSENTLVFTEEAAEEEAAEFAWTPVDFGYDAAVQYSLQFDAEGGDFSDARSISMSNQLDSTLTVAELNAIATQLGLEPEVAHNVAVRVMAQVFDPAGPSEFVDPVLSNTVELSVTPYSTEVVLPSVYVPGGYQGWDPASATTLVSEEDNGIYEGYVYFPEDADLIFKITSEPSWDGTNYGDGGEGMLSTDGGAGNLSVPEPGTYFISANTNDLTWSATPGGWAIIGNATGSWDVDTDMAYNREEGTWSITTDLVPGELKFRLNDDWGTNYGDDDTSDGLLNLGGGNIPISEAGTYEIILDLSDEESPRYSITQL